MPDQDILDAVAADHSQRAYSNLAGTEGVQPDQAAAALKDGPKVGIPPAVAMKAPEATDSLVRDAVQQDGLQHPAVSRWAADADPAALGAAKDDLHNLAKIGDKAGTFNPAPFEQIAKAAGAYWGFVQQISSHMPIVGDQQKIVQGVGKLQSLAIEPFAQALGRIPGKARVDTSPFPSILIPGAPTQQTADTQAKIEQWRKDIGLATFALGGAGEAAGAADIAAAADHAIPPTQPPHGGPGGVWTVTGDGHVADTGGNPVVWPTQRAAADWLLKEGYKSGTDQIFEVSNAPEQGYVLKESGRTATGSPGVGGNAGVDAVRSAVAESDAAQVKDLQDTIAESATHQRAPEVMKDFLGQQVSEKLAYVDAGKAIQLFNEHGVSFEDQAAFFDGQTDYAAFQETANEGGAHPVPLSTYLSATAGKPWAEQLNKITSFREGGVSLDEAKDLGSTASSPPPTPFEISRYKDLDTDEAEAIKNAIPAIEKQVATLSQELYLKDMFENNKALGLTSAQYADYSERIKQAHLDLYDKMVEKLRSAIKKQRTMEWKQSYSKHFGYAMTDTMRSPVVKAAYALKYGTEESAIAATLKGADGKPITFYHGTNYPNVTKWEIGQYSNRAGISFAENANFASDWAQGKGTDSFVGKHPVVYITHVLGQGGDFRNPADVKKAVDFYVNEFRKNYPELADNKYDLESFIAGRKKALERGDWGIWENSKLIKANKWDFVRMVEHEGQEGPPNIFVADADKIIFKFQDQGGVQVKISLNPAQKKLFPKELIKDLPQGIWADGGKTADEVADQFGFLDGETMLREVAALNNEAKLGGKSLKNYIKDQANALAFQRAQEELGFDLSPEGIMQAALDEVREPSPKDVVLDELRALQRMTGLPLSKGSIEDYAFDRFSRLPVEQASNVKAMQKNVYRAGEKTQKALQKGDMPTAFIHKQQQYLHVLLLDQAHEFRKEYARGLAKVRAWGSGSFPGHMDPNFQAIVQQEIAIAGMPLRRGSAELGRYLAQAPLQSAESAVQYMNLNGVPTNVPELSSPLKQSNVGDFRDWMNSVGALAKFGRDIGEIDFAGERQALDAVANEIMTNALALGQKFTPEQLVNERATAYRKMRLQVKTLLVNNIRPEVYLNWLDHGKIGPLMKGVVKPLMDGKYTETDLTDAWVKAMKAANKDHSVFQTMNNKVLAPPHMAVDTAFGPVEVIQNRGNLRAAILHLGSYTARMKLLKGFGWGEEQEKWLLENATKEDWAFARAFWDENEKLFAKSDQMYMRVRGYGLKKDAVRDIELPSGETIKGGYVHIQYNRALKQLTRISESEGIEPDLSGGTLLDAFPATKLPSQGYSIERTGYTGPIQLDHRYLSSGVSEVIHDIAFREALIQSQKILKDPRVGQSLASVLGPEYAAQTMPWLTYIAQQRMLLDPATEQAAQWVRMLSNNLVFAKVAYNLSSVVKHSGLGAVHMAGELKGDVVGFAKASNDLIGIGNKAQYWRNFVEENSGEVRGIRWNVDTNIQDALGANTLSGNRLDQFRQLGYALFTKSKELEAYATWLTKYRQTMVEDGTHLDAVETANKAVRDTQGAGSVVDLPPALRHGHGLQGEIGRLVAGALMGFRGTVPNRLFTAKRDLGQAFRLAREGKFEEAADYGKDAMRIGAAFVIGTALWLAVYGTFIYGFQAKGKSKTQTAADEFLWGLADETIGGLVGLANIESGLHYAGSGAGGDLLQSYSLDVQKLMQDKGHRHFIRDGWDLFADVVGMPESFGKAVQAAADQFDHRVPKREKTPAAAAQRVLLGRATQRR